MCTHYVDINSIGGACSDSNSGTSETNPWCTLGKAASTAAAGNVVCVRAGTYSETLRPANSGTAGNLITFKAYPGEECTMSTDYTVRPTCSVWIGGATINRNYVKVEGFEFANHPGEPIVCGINTNNISIVNNYIHDSGDNGISCVISNNLLIERNYIRDTGNNGMDLRIGIGISTNITIRGNAILDTECDGMDFTGNNIVFENNVLGIIDRFSGCHQDGMEVTEPVNGLIIRNNRIFDYTQLIYLAPDGPSIENVEIYGNIIYLVNYGGDAPGIVVGSPVRNVSIHSNTFGDLHGNAGIRMSGGDDVTARNNIFYIGRISGGDDPELNSNYNIFFSPTGGRIIDSETNLDTYRSTHPGRETNSIQADPLFVNYDYIGKSSFDFRLKSASPAIDKGDPNLAALFTLPLPFKDTDGTSRPQGSALDMGAYEFPQIVSCNTNADCNNGLFCDGQEVCSAGLCSDSADPCIADSYSCTTTCDEATDSCNVLNNAACNDNNACTINDRCVGATGDSITGCAYDFAASGTSCTISGAQCAPAQQCNGAGTCTATANVALCTNPNNCASVSCNANNYQCEYSGCACQTSSSTWTNNGFTSQTGTFTVEFDSTPNNAAMDGVIGLSNGAQTAYSSFSALVRFNSGGVIDVYDSTGYRADVLVPYTASTAYHIKMIVNVPAQTYDAFVRVGSGSEQQIANDYRFRSTALATSLNNWAIYSSSGTLNVCNFVLSTPLTCTDNDLDGYNQSASGCGTADCNDNNALEKPGQIWYVDSDNDGYSTLLAVTQCSRPLGYKAASELISISGDCNDANPSIKPGATEICDGLDNNCDTTIDNGGNALCNNGAFCDGVEICGGTSGCQVGTVPCNPATHTCIEATDSCQLLPGTCTTNADCSDGIFCNGAESCVGGSCIAGTQVVCNDNITCTIDSCSAVFDTCVFSANHAGCDNGQYCDGTELCVVDVGCQTGTPITCAPDSFSCTDDTCNEVTDECIYQENNAGCPLYSQGQICSIANFPAPTGCGFVQNCVDADNDGLLDYNINKCPIGKDYCDYTNKTYFENNPNELIRYLPDRGDYNISEVNLSNIFNYSNFTIKLENIGEIIFREGINLIRINESGCFEKLNFNITDLIKIEDKRIFVNGSMHSEFSKPAKLIFQNINFVQPKILRDGAECSSSACLIVNYSNNRLEVEVPGFSLYEVVEGFVSPPPGDGGGGGGGGGGGTRPRACAVEWACTSWGDCIDGIQTRTCFDNKNCNVLTNKPTERQECRLTAGIVTNETAVAPGDIVGETVKWFTEKAVIILIVVLTIVLIAIIIVLTVTRSRKTENKKQELISGSMGNRFMNYVQENKLVSFLIVFIFSLFLLSVVFNDKNKILLSPSDALGSNFAIGISLIVLLILIILLLKGEKKEGGIERDREKVLKNIRKEFR
ncbi:right-handed parallel beta-helix repeat-containing protein [Candidatus Pacearchaeota archaeon]|nr:right-handed parallel beta-helix repeat-containing protein [Candidatus Pacearchaeota archaeon]